LLVLVVAYHLTLYSQAGAPFILHSSEKCLINVIDPSFLNLFIKASISPISNEQGYGVFTFIFPSLFPTFSNLVRSGITSHRKAVRKAITLALKKDISVWNVAEWGYYFPIYNALNIKKTKNNISYSIIVKTEKKPIKLRITISPKRHKSVVKESFQKNKEFILSEIEKKLREYQQELNSCLKFKITFFLYLVLK